MRKGTFSKYFSYYFTITLTFVIIVFGLMYAHAEPTPKSTPSSKTTFEPSLKTKAPGSVPLLNYGGREVSLGKPAPLTIVMYYSLTCPHCHEYQKDELPVIQKEFIDKGLVQFILRDFPTDSIAIKAAKIAWCHGKKDYLSFSQKLLKTQDRWVPKNENEIEKADKVLYDIATKELGISDTDYHKCVANENIEASILRQSFEAQKVYQIDGAPAFLINGKYHEGILTVETIQSKLLEMGIYGWATASRLGG